MQKRRGSRIERNAWMLRQPDSSGPSLGSPVPTYCGDDCCLGRIGQARQAKQHHTRVEETLAKDQLAEVLVGGHQNGAPNVRLLQDFLIWDAGGGFGYMNDVMAVPS